MANNTYHPRGVLIHGYSARKHPLYYVWADMKRRCSNPSDKSWKDYGGRGITFCAAWEHFANFAADMWPRPDGLELDRKDNNKGYCKDNCHWVTRPKNAQNKRVYKTNRFDSHGVGSVGRGRFWCRYMRDGVRYNLGRFATVDAAERFRECFKDLLSSAPDRALLMLVRRKRGQL